MKILLCLLSQQHTPNLLSVHHFRPDALVLVESGGMKRLRAAEHFLKALSLGGLDYAKRVTVVPLEAEDDLTTIRAALQLTHAAQPGGEWVVNLTGGTKPMSIAAYAFFESLGARLIYTNVAHPAEMADLLSREVEVCHYEMASREFLAGYGFEIEQKDTKLKAAEDRARLLWPCARAIVERIGGRDLLRLSPERRAEARDKGLPLTRDDLGDAADLLDVVCGALGLDSTQLVLGEIDKYQADFLTGGYLEAFVWSLLERHAEALKIWDVRLNLGIKNPKAKNELDVSFLHDNTLCVIECKTGKQEHDARGESVLYKIEAVTRQLRSLRVRKWVVTTSDAVQDPVTQKVRATLSDRAALYDCRIIDRPALEQLARAPHDAALLASTVGLFPRPAP